MSSQPTPNPTLGASIDDGLDRFFGWLGRNIARVIIAIVAIVVFWWLALPLLIKFSSALPIVLSLLFQLLFAVFFMV
ncbi:MAG: hypothetical protein M1118_03895, partial [Chloroflexi bacterium]|nr:hypothetical protein [Chloroflexota bacterium]